MTCLDELSITPRPHCLTASGVGAGRLLCFEGGVSIYVVLTIIETGVASYVLQT